MMERYEEALKAYRMLRMTAKLSADYDVKRFRAMAAVTAARAFTSR